MKCTFCDECSMEKKFPLANQPPPSDRLHAALQKYYAANNLTPEGKSKDDSPAPKAPKFIQRIKEMLQV